jgi:ABC-type uncharacterized transport system auxiliary subunit
MSREAMQMALEALERYGGVDQRACDAEEALRQALETEREWVGLTEEEVKYIADSEWEEAFVRLVEAKLKEKNQ